MIRSYKSSNHRLRARKQFMQAIAKNILIIILLCFFVKFLSFMGADAFCERFLSKIAQNESFISTILGFEMGYVDTDKMYLLDTIFPTNSSDGATDSYFDKGTEQLLSSDLPNGEGGSLVSGNSSVSSTHNFTDIGEIELNQIIKAGVEGNIKDLSGFNIDFSKYLSDDTKLSTDYSEVTVLIIHTHGSEAYKPDGEDIYVASDPSRTEDCNYNMIRVGEELTAILRSRGINVIHDTSLYDYPSYNGSYTRSLNAIVSYLDKDPTIKVVIDLHRDAASDGDNPYKTTTVINGETTSQVMIISGTNATGLWHPLWEENLKFALLLQGCMNIKYPGLARPLYITEYRYNQHATTGSLIVEVGYNGNTLQEALGAVRYFGDSMSDVITLLTKDSKNNN